MRDYSISFHRSAEKDMRRLSSSVRDRVIEAVEGLAKSPRPSGCKKLAGSDKAYRIRIGDYRVVYSLRHRADRGEVYR